MLVPHGDIDWTVPCTNIQRGASKALVLGRTQQDLELDQDRWCSSAPNWTDEIPARARPKSPCGWCSAAPNRSYTRIRIRSYIRSRSYIRIRIRNYTRIWIRS